MPTAETITCDPSQFIKNRIELGLDDMGLAIRGEPDWGDSEIELFLVRQALGEIPADRHPPNRNVALDLMVMNEGIETLAAAAAKLQKKAGTWQREGGFVKRVLDPAAGFTTDVAAQVRGASLGGIEGWLMAHRQKAPDVTLNLVTGPYFYGVKEEESILFKAENATHLKWELANIKGSAPGIMRMLIKNEGAVDWKGLLTAVESRYLDQTAAKNTTADTIYECENLTPKGGSAVVEKSESSSGKVIENSALSAGYIQVLSSKIAASGLHMTHTGPRRFWIRAFDPGSTTENIELKLEWRALGSARWSENRAVKVPVIGDFSKIDLGEVIPEAAVLGEQRWEWRLLARARNGVGTIRLDNCFVLTTEQFIALNAPPSSINLTPDSQSVKSPLTAENDAAVGAVAWTSPTSVLTSNNVYASCKLKGIQETNYIKTKKYGFAIPGGATVLGIVASVEGKQEGGLGDPIAMNRCHIMKAGVIKTEVNRASGDLPSEDLYTHCGGSTDLFGQTWTPAQINEEGFGAAFSWSMISFGPGEPTLKIDHVKITVYYTEEKDENRVCFATRSVEVRSDGAYRQHLTDDVWGKGVPDGFLPYSPPSGLEARAVRGILVPSKGDHLAQADSGLHKLSARVFYFPGYHFVSEA